MTTRRQLAFYEEGSVLGAQSVDQTAVGNDKDQSSFSNWLQKVFEGLALTLERIDHFIIDFWQSLFEK